MNLSNLAPAWRQFKVENSLDDIPEAEILSAISRPKTKVKNALLIRVIQNVFAYTLLIFALHGCVV